jgi:hypothetical protein
VAAGSLFLDVVQTYPLSTKKPEFPAYWRILPLALFVLVGRAETPEKAGDSHFTGII